MDTSKTIVKEEHTLKAADQSGSVQFGGEKNNLSIIKFGIDAEIDKALSLYCKNELRLSKVYWPKAFRSLSTYILEFLLKKPDIWSEIRTQSYDFDGKQLQRLIDELKFPTSPYITVLQRRLIYHVLMEVSLYRRKFGLSVRLPKFCSESMDWPCDLEDKDDLSSSMTHMSLRDDVRKFIWKILDEVIPAERYCNMHYFGAVKWSGKSLPIVIEVTVDYLEKVSDRITTVSDHLRSLKYENLLPVDLVEVRGVPVRNAVVSNEEGFYTPGSPWKYRTVGGILKYGRKIMGITSGHVHHERIEDFDSLCNDPAECSSNRFIDSTVDVAFFTFANEQSDDRLFNLLPMKYIGAMSDVNLQIGENVYKIGRSTGLTVGKLGSIESTFRSGGFRYEDHVQVLWNDDSCRFAFSMDCGSIYCVKRGPMYVPIGIHRISDTLVSYGCSIWKAMECFPEEDGENDLNFVNHPFLIVD